MRSRFIPAGAGNTAALTEINYALPVYPRWRGEHTCSAIDINCDLGLSPLARGTHLISNLSAVAVRFIPAGAGNTTDSNGALISITVYPRWRGEHHIKEYCRGFEIGLSPLARGTPVHNSQNSRYIRFIPAGAGNTTGRHEIHVQQSVYPRWRGEHVAVYRRFTRQLGLSPLARGTHWRLFQPGRVSRFIPAGAGNTAAPPTIKNCFTVYPRWRGEHNTLTC